MSDDPVTRDELADALRLAEYGLANLRDLIARMPGGDQYIAAPVDRWIDASSAAVPI